MARGCRCPRRTPAEPPRPGAPAVTSSLADRPGRTGRRQRRVRRPRRGVRRDRHGLRCAWVRAYDVGTTVTPRRHPATVRVTGLAGASLIEGITHTYVPDEPV